MRRDHSMAVKAILCILLCAGFSAEANAQDCACVRCDVDGDTDVDLHDYGALQACMTGPGTIQSDPSCLWARLDGDPDVDDVDLQVFTACLTGSQVPLQLGPEALPVITEVMAVNDTGLVDEDGDHTDWLEVYNPCEVSINLEGWYLTDKADNLTKWQVPFVEVPAHGFLVVHASDKNRAVPGQPLHTNYKIDGDGEYTALVKPDGVTVVSEYAPQIPLQLPDISYGLPMDAGGNIIPGAPQYFVIPTPGSANDIGSESLGPFVTSVVHTPQVPGDSDVIDVAATAVATFYPVSTATLHYRVMWGSTTSTPMYDDGAHNDGLAGDGVFGASIPANISDPGEMVRYYITMTDTQGTESRWPHFADPNASPEYYGTVIDDPALVSTLPILQWFLLDPAAAETETGTRGALFYLGEFYDNIFFRERGGSASLWPKKNFKIEFNKRNHFLYDLTESRVDEFNLQSTYSDKSYLRQVLAWETYENAGVPGCKSFPMRVQQNQQFFSVAVFVEQIDGDFMRRHDLDDDGALYKMYNQLYQSDVDVEKKNREYEDNSDLQALIDCHHHTNPQRLECLLDNVNIPEVINYIAATTIMHDNDHVAKNYYLYRDSDGTGEWQMFPWDKDLTFGRNYDARLGSGSAAVLNDTIWADDDSISGWPGKPSHPLFGSFPYPKIDGAWNGLITAIMDVPELREMYLRRLRTLMDDLLQPPGTPAGSLLFEQRIDELVALIQADVVLDRAEWGNPYGTNQDLATAIGILKNQYLAVRRTHLFNTHGPSGSGLIPAAQPAQPAITFGTIEHTPAVDDGDAEYFELINANAFAVDLSGWQVSGAVELTFQPGTVMRAGTSMYVTNKVQDFRARTIPPTGGQGLFIQGGYDGKLSPDGETIYLFDNVGYLIDTVTYTP